MYCSIQLLIAIIDNEGPFRHLLLTYKMLRTTHITIAVFLLALCVLVDSSFSQEQDTLQKEKEPSVVKLRDGIYKIGPILLDRNKDEVSLNGEVNMRKGLIEYLACARRGKLHESVLVLDVEPYQLQVALLLLGLEPRGNLEYQGDPRTPQGDSVEVLDVGRVAG